MEGSMRDGDRAGITSLSANRSTVMAGLDPAIQTAVGQAEPSLDPRVKPGDDHGGWNRGQWLARPRNPHSVIPAQARIQ
jgi:hypothetical protein